MRRNREDSRRTPRALLVLAFFLVSNSCVPRNMDQVDGPAPRVSALVESARDLGERRPEADVSAIVALRSKDGEPVLAFMRESGLRAEWRPGDSWVTISGRTDRVQSLFRVKVYDYVRGSKRFYASQGMPHIPELLVAFVGGISRITDYPDLSGHSWRPAVPPGGLRPIDLKKAYDMQSLVEAGASGRGETIVFFELPGNYRQSDYDTFTAKFNLPPLHTDDHGVKQPAPFDASEVTMDFELVHEIAPDARLKTYFVDPAIQTLKGELPLMRQLVEENPGAIVVLEAEACEAFYDQAQATAFESLWQRAAQLGETVLVPSGDVGGYECLEVNNNATPSDQYVGVSLFTSPPSVTSVGGTRLSVRADGNYYQEQVWEEPAGIGGGGGGLSTFYPRPSYQTGPAPGDQSNPPMRRVPDVSADADPATGAAVYITQCGGWCQGGGTSQSGPIWAGMMALINQYLREHNSRAPGFLNPVLYRLAAGHPRYPPFHDITVGTNLVYAAAPGYDMATGLGTPDAWNMARDIAELQPTSGTG